jgi:hypothetical protein
MKNRVEKGRDALLDRKIYLNVDVRRLDALVTEPEGDYDHVDSGLQQVHSAGVSYKMRSYPFCKKAICNGRKY